MSVTYHAAEANRLSIRSKRKSRDRKLHSPQYIFTENLFNKPKKLDHVAWLVLLGECAFSTCMRAAPPQHNISPLLAPQETLHYNAVRVIENFRSCRIQIPLGIPLSLTDIPLNGSKVFNGMLHVYFCKGNIFRLIVTYSSCRDTFGLKESV